MSELESSGLLAEQQAAVAEAVASGGAGATAAGADASEANGKTAAGADAGAAGDALAAVDAAAGGGDGGAEQRVLGYLAQAPEWCKCLDTGSGKIYFWNLTSGEVMWEAPEGLDGGQLIPPEAQEQGQGEGQGQQGEGQGAESATARAAEPAREGQRQKAAGGADAKAEEGGEGVGGDVEMATAGEEDGGTEGPVVEAEPGTEGGTAVGVATGTGTAKAGHTGEAGDSGEAPEPAEAEAGAAASRKSLEMMTNEEEGERAGEAPHEGDAEMADADTGEKAESRQAPGAGGEKGLEAGGNVMVAETGGRGRGGGGEGPGNGELAAELAGLLLRPPQPHVDAVMAALEAEAAEAAKCYLQVGLVSQVLPAGGVALADNRGWRGTGCVRWLLAP